MKPRKKLELRLSNEGLSYAQKVLKEMQKDSDRATAILLGAELDDILQQILSKRLLPPKSKSARLLEQDSPMGSFSARIELAYRLGLINPLVHGELHLIRKIRNEFAHKKAGFSFKTQAISQLTSALALPKAVNQFFLKKHKEPFNPDSRSRFVCSGAILLWRLTILQEQVKRIRVLPDIVF
jgi:DNA-binding MltR family transcriptional regulator